MNEMQAIEELIRKHEQANNEIISMLTNQYENHAQTEKERDELLEQLHECYRQRDEMKTYLSIYMDIRQRTSSIS